MREKAFLGQKSCRRSSATASLSGVLLMHGRTQTTERETENNLCTHLGNRPCKEVAYAQRKVVLIMRMRSSAWTLKNCVSHTMRVHIQVPLGFSWCLCGFLLLLFSSASAMDFAKENACRKYYKRRKLRNAGQNAEHCILYKLLHFACFPSTRATYTF